MFAIIISTSPIPICPSTELINAVIASLDAKEIKDCPVYIVCDGYKLSTTQTKYKNGIIRSVDEKRYEQYRINIKVKYPDYNVVELSERHGFAYAVKSVLDIIKTEFVLVIQHGNYQHNIHLYI